MNAQPNSENLNQAVPHCILYIYLSYVNMNYKPRKILHDNTVNTVREAKERDLTVGADRTTGKGQRAIMVHMGKFFRAQIFFT